tara:strand:+ start:5561 stop:6607 length:1047 start_codon:yes stop_codon:yes gene_type:complete
VNRPRHTPRRTTALAAGALALLALALIALSAWRHTRVPRLVERAADLRPAPGLRWYLPDAGTDSVPRSERWTGTPPDPVPARAVLLVHGLDEPGGIWDALAPALAETGHPAVRFEYPNDQPPARSAALLADALADLRRAGVTSLDIVAHSMGGLVATDVLTRPEFDNRAGPRVPLLVTVGTPFDGSPWADLQPVSELREQIQRWIESDDADPARLFAAWHDGLGEAGADLRPGSDYLTELAGRPWPEGTRLVCIVGIYGPTAIPTTLAELSVTAADFGDGVVPAPSAARAGASETLLVPGNHRSILRPIEIEAWIRERLGAAPPPQPAAIPLILERLAGGQGGSGDGQ